ncbi:hypothetical protein PISMIDRAFT_16762 [Pisolithus microcarpus 441]|uniref:G domain-containing protein n=1 Tax=Pisolithus microcarpus 441 TaxID=765257 RepID=A0A0C9Z511_9AGAM|nr:hypothetical protein BKA83DRAFT_16762 [Pisolithus microcarpus]KIK15078.1 hypothetical protein PISMIDRAFT_16762 [Pisolithus microcarpus 441]
MYGFRTAIFNGSNVDETDIELRSAKNVEYIEVLFLGCRRSIRQQDKNHFREEFPESLTVQGEAFSFLVHWKRWYSSSIPAVNNVQIDVRDVLADSRSHKFQIKRSKLNITIGLWSDRPSAEVAPIQDNSTPPITDSLRPTTEALLDQCPRFRILVIGQSGVGKSTLIHRTFGIEQASAENLTPGRVNIGEELISPQNDRIVLHYSDGFGPADNVNCDAVKSFIADRKSRELVKDQLHAVWLCFRIPIKSHGDRLLENGAETFLKKDTSVLRNIPTIVVFTKYDRLLTHMQMEKEADPETAAKQYLQKHCINPIEEFARGANVSYVAVSSNPRLERSCRQLVDLTHRKVTEKFRLRPDKPSPVSIVFLMAQRISPDSRILRSIDVCRQRYWRMLTSGANFKDHTINECLAVIHTDIVRVWDFNDPSQYLYSDEFRRLMANLTGTINEFTLGSHRLARVTTTSSLDTIFTAGLSISHLIPFILPLEAGIGLVHRIHQQISVVRHKFMAYIVDLDHILEILFSLTANNNKRKLTRGAVSSAFDAYYDSEMRRNVHRQIKGFHHKIPGRDGVLDKIITLVRTSPIDDSEISGALGSILPETLAQDDEWFRGTQNASCLSST